MMAQQTKAFPGRLALIASLSIALAGTGARAAEDAPAQVGTEARQAPADVGTQPSAAPETAVASAPADSVAQTDSRKPRFAQQSGQKRTAGVLFVAGAAFALASAAFFLIEF